jgi:hypothetical protein
LPDRLKTTPILTTSLCRTESFLLHNIALLEKNLGRYFALKDLNLHLSQALKAYKKTLSRSKKLANPIEMMTYSLCDYNLHMQA